MKGCPSSLYHQRAERLAIMHFPLSSSVNILHTQEAENFLVMQLVVNNGMHYTISNAQLRGDLR